MSESISQTKKLQLALCPNPIFIVGSPRSGTTILAWSLAQHSRLWTSEEAEILFDLFGNGKLQRAFDKALERPNPSWLKVQGVDKGSFFQALGIGLNNLATRKSNGKRWIEQTPQYGLMADELAEMFPGALFIHILRDGRHVVHSMINVTNKYSHEAMLARQKSGHLPPWPKDFRSACVAWRVSVETCLAFQSKHPERCITVQNERLVRSPVDEFQRIFQFLGEPVEQSVVDYFLGNRINSSFPEEAKKSPVHASRPNPWLKWDLQRRMTFLDEAGQTMLKAGLATENELSPICPEHSLQVLAIRRACHEALPVDATVAVISKGDPELLNLHGRRAWHLPQEPDGTYAGSHPEDSEEAIRHLEGLRRKGADYLLIPGTSFWWLEHYPGFGDHVNARYSVCHRSDACIIYHLQTFESAK